MKVYPLVGGVVGPDGFRLSAPDAYELYSYIYDVVKYRQGGLFRAKMPPQTYQEMAEDWAEANSHLAPLKSSFWLPEIIEQLGFRLNEEEQILID